MYKAIVIDEEGFFIKEILTEEVLQDERIIYDKCENGFYKPKWNGEVWVEGAEKEYIDYLHESQKPDSMETLINQVNFLTLENKKKDIQIESLMKAIIQFENGGK